MGTTRRSLLVVLVSSAVLTLSGCGMPSILPSFPGASPAKPKTRVAGLYSEQIYGGQNERLSVLLQQGVDTLSAAKDS